MSTGTTTVETASRNDKVTYNQLVEDFKKLGVRSGYMYNVKASLKSIGYVEGGAKTVINALLEAVSPDGTIVTDSFVNVWPLPLSAKHAAIISDRNSPSYAGAIANAMLKHPDAFCSSHPIQRFVAIGANAEKLMSRHTPESYAYNALKEMAESGYGRNLKIGTDEKVVGVGTTHVAIGMMKFHQDRPPCGVNYRNGNGEIELFKRNWAGGCGVGFNKFIPIYRERGAILREGTIGQAPSKITDMAHTLAIELEILKENPAFFMCDDPACADCRLTWEFSTGNKLSVNCHRALRKLRRLLGSLYYGRQ